METPTLYLTIWALVDTCKESREPDVLDCVFLPHGATWDDAAVLFGNSIADETDAPEELQLTTAKQVREYLKSYNDRSRSLFVVRVFPPGNV